MPLSIRLSVLLGLLLISAVGSAQSSDCLDYADYPHWISHLDTPVWASDLIVEGDLAYLAIRTAGIVIVDVSDPWHPVQIGSLGPADDPAWHPTASRLILSGIHLFVSDGTGRLVHVLDVSDPTGPVHVTVLAAGEYSGATHRVSWDGNDSQGKASPAGCYFLLLRGDQNSHSLKIMLVR